MDELEIFRKIYSDESLHDLERDLFEDLNDENFNPVLKEIPRMEKYPEFRDGSFEVIVTWKAK